MRKSIIGSYFLILGIMLGIEFAIGAFLAPVLFFPTEFIGEGVLTHYQSGILMTQVFLRFNMVLFFSMVLLFLFEIYLQIKVKKDFISLIILLAMATASAFFIYYFTPFIVQAQSQGADATRSLEFLKIHKMSEFDMKAIMIFQIALFFRKVVLFFKNL